MKRGFLKMAAMGLFVATGAWAGTKLPYEVSIDSSKSTANGALGTVRNTGDTTQYIGCSHYVDGGVEAATCFARSATGVMASCVTSDAKLLSVIENLPSDGYLQFKWDTFANCTSVLIYSASYTAPKNP